MTPLECGPVEKRPPNDTAGGARAPRAVDATKFGRRPEEAPNGTLGGEPLGALLGVFGSAFCATVERFSGGGALRENGYRETLARAVADPKTGDPGKSILKMATFHDPFDETRTLELADAGFSHNQGRKRVRQSQLQRLISRSFSTRFG